MNTLAAHAQHMPLPADVRLMNGIARALFAGLGALALAALAAWAWRSAALPIRAIEVEGEVQRNNVATLRANVMPKLTGNILSIDLQRARSAFESAPWVRRAEVRRVWPDRLKVRLAEHQAVALWAGDDGNDRLVNAQGEVFEANLGDVEDDGLPSFNGPAGSSAAMLDMYRRVQPLAARLGGDIVQLSLSARGSWRVELERQVTLELGRGSEAEVVARTEVFVRTLAQVLHRYPGAPLEHADLRHAQGYALRLHGVTTVAALEPKK